MRFSRARKWKVGHPNDAVLEIENNPNTEAPQRENIMPNIENVIGGNGNDNLKGNDSANVLDHCRDTAQVHFRGCWVVDLVLGKE